MPPNTFQIRRAMRPHGTSQVPPVLPRQSLLKGLQPTGTNMVPCRRLRSAQGVQAGGFISVSPWVRTSVDHCTAHVRLSGVLPGLPLGGVIGPT